MRLTYAERQLAYRKLSDATRARHVAALLELERRLGRVPFRREILDELDSHVSTVAHYWGRPNGATDPAAPVSYTDIWGNLYRAAGMVPHDGRSTRWERS